MKHLYIITTFLLIVGKILPQQIYELYPTRTSSVSYALQNTSMLDCYSELRTNAFNYGPFMPAINVSFYLSTDTSITPSDFKIADCAVPCMNGSNCGTFVSLNSLEHLHPVSATGVDLSYKNIPNGEYYVGVYLDPEDVIPEFTSTNNGAPLKNMAGNLFIVKHHVWNVGIGSMELKNDIEKRFVNQELLIQSHSGDKFCVELFSIDGKLIFKAAASSIVIPKQDAALCLLKMSNEKGIFIGKCLFGQ